MPDPSAQPQPISLRNAWGETALLHPWGGQLLHWRSARGIDRLYLSPRAVTAGRGAVRGGVPVVFPQFGRHGPLDAHGFARTAWWQALPRTRQSLAGMTLVCDGRFQARWPYPCQLAVSVDIGWRHTLQLRLQLLNTGPDPLQFCAALHTYLAIDVRHAQLTGLHSPHPLALYGPLDQVHAASERCLQVSARGVALRVKQDGFAQTVIWNPGPRHMLPDLPAHGDRHFVCVEAAQVAPLTLAPGASWTGTQTLHSG